ncbi:MAG: PrsW family intramembrane metalloprotease [Anaerolineaceae bacterium]|nr:PrsW family intramembrane metalloprotease [Anaerolineaceae bacterium]
MGILCAVLSLPVSILLVRWLMKKKTENPFEKGEVRRLVLAGMLSMVVAAVVTLLILCIRAYRLIGIDTLNLWMSNPDPETIKNSLEDIHARSSGQTYWSAFAGTFLSVGLVEELSRFLFVRLATRNKGFAKTWLDLVICGGIIGVGFQLLEDITYVNGDLITAIFRAVTPFHFTFGTIMGLFIGKAMESGKKSYHIPAILIPALLHTLFDSSISALQMDDLYFVLVLASGMLLIGLSVFMIIKINNWAKL